MIKNSNQLNSTESHSDLIKPIRLQGAEMLTVAEVMQLKRNIKEKAALLQKMFPNLKIICKL